MLASMHCTDVYILHILPASVHHAVVNIFKCTVDLRPLSPGPQLEFKPQRQWKRNMLWLVFITFSQIHHR